MNWEIDDVGNIRARECVCVCGVGGWVRFEPCVLPKMSISSSVHLFKCSYVRCQHVCVQRTLFLLLTPFNCYCAHKCATQQ